MPLFPGFLLVTGFPLRVLATVAGMFAVVLGLPMGLYLLLTRGQRGATREIRTAASEHGWKYRLRRWQGDPTAFRIDGRTKAGQPWTVTSGTTRGYDPGWTVQLVLRFSMLGGETDAALLPREGESPARAGAAILAGAESRIANLSGVLAGAIGFLRDAREFPSGLAAFDAAYQVLGLPPRIHQPPVDAALAARILEWPSGAIAPHSVLAWRDPFGFELQARLPAQPNWATVSYLLALADQLIARVPPPVKSTAPPRFVDRLIGRFLR